MAPPRNDGSKETAHDTLIVSKRSTNGTQMRQSMDLPLKKGKIQQQKTQLVHSTHYM